MPEADPRLAAQLNLILDTLDRSAVHPSDWETSGEFHYMYRKGCVLVLDPDEDRVTQELREILATDDVPFERVEITAERGFVGVTRLSWPEAATPAPDGPSVYDQLDARLGTGVARPEHVLYVCPPYPCPATEPEEVPSGTVEPSPGPGQDYPCPDGYTQPRATGRHCDGDGVRVAMVDTGWVSAAATEHWWLAGVTGDEEDPYLGDGTIRIYGGHGTFGASCVRSMAPRSSVVVKGALLHAGAAFETDVVERLAAALEESPDVVVFVCVAPTRKTLTLLGFDALYESRIRQLKGTAFLAPAGNDSEYTTKYPAGYDWVLSVGALSANWRDRAYFSNYGGWVDLYAPGEGLIQAFVTGTYRCTEPPNKGVRRKFQGMAKWSGTSFSTPLVAGLIAARMSATGESATLAADTLQRLAREQAIPGVGPVLFPGQACFDPPGCGCSG